MCTVRRERKFNSLVIVPDGPIDISACEADEVEKALGLEPEPEEESDDDF